MATDGHSCGFECQLASQSHLRCMRSSERARGRLCGQRSKPAHAESDKVLSCARFPAIVKPFLLFRVDRELDFDSTDTAASPRVIIRLPCTSDQGSASQVLYALKVRRAPSWLQLLDALIVQTRHHAQCNLLCDTTANLCDPVDHAFSYQ